MRRLTMAIRGILLIRSMFVVLVATFFVGDSRSGLENVQSSHFSPYLYVWAGGEDRQNSDFLAVIDALPESKSYGQVISTTSVNENGTMPHHTEYEFPKDGLLFANGWAGNKTFIFDIRSPTLPRITREFGSVGGYSFLHSTVRLPNGHVLATFQGKGNAYVPTGALVELDEQGQLVRLSSASAPGVKNSLIWPYSLAALPTVDRVVTSSFVMGFPDWAILPPGSWSQAKINSTDTKHLQIWSLSKLTLLSTIALPPSPEGTHGMNPSEPRVLSDGSVYVGTFNCGLYHLHGLTGKNPSAHFVFAFPGGDLNKTPCGVPVVVGKFWVQTVAALPGLIVLDVSNPEQPKEVSRLTFDDRFRHPHWIAADRQTARLVVTGSMESWLLLVNIDEGTGKLSVDNAFREMGHDEVGLDFAHVRGPEGKTGVSFPHGALFGPN